MRDGVNGVVEVAFDYQGSDFYNFGVVRISGEDLTAEIHDQGELYVSPFKFPCQHCS